MKSSLNYSHPQVVMQEVPGEISLALSVSGCSLRCPGCHSAISWNPKYGLPLTELTLKKLIVANTGISCVLFYGGEWDMPELTKLVRVVNDSSLKVALYTGEELDYFTKEFLTSLDFIKTGRWKRELGGLGSANTNQRLYKIVDGGLINIKEQQ